MLLPHSSSVQWPIPQPTRDSTKHEKNIYIGNVYEWSFHREYRYSSKIFCYNDLFIVIQYVSKTNLCILK